MSRTHKDQRAHVLRSEGSLDQQEPFHDGRWGDARKVRSRLKRHEHHARRQKLLDPLDPAASVKEQVPHGDPPWRHDHHQAA